VTTPDATQSAIQYRAIVQRDLFGPHISLDSLFLVTTLYSATDKVEPKTPSGGVWLVQTYHQQSSVYFVRHDAVGLGKPEDSD
jgi:hypothetical protein